MYIKLSFSMTLILYLSFVWSDSSKIKLSVYFESICPDSRKFFIEQLGPTYDSFGNLLDIELIPFGNSNWTYDTTTRDVTFRCQHGNLECFGNRIQSCIIAKAGNNSGTSLKFIECMFSSRYWRRPDISAKNCSQQMGIDWSALNDCSVGPYSVVLQLEMSNKTNSLKPPQNWIPWITIDGKHSDEIQSLAESDLQKLVCDRFSPNDKPNQCRRQQLRDAKYESIPFNRYINRDGVIEP